MQSQKCWLSVPDDVYHVGFKGRSLVHRAYIFVSNLADTMRLSRTVNNHVTPTEDDHIL